MLAAAGCLGAGPTLPEPPPQAGSSEGTTTGGSPSDASTTGGLDTETGVGTGVGTGVADSTGAIDSSSGEPPPEDCETNVDACDTWLLRPGTVAWEARRTFYDSPHAPAALALAAFDIDESNEGYVLTQSTYHVMDLVAGEWVGSGPLVDVMPAVAAYGGLVAAYSVHNVGRQETATLLAADGHYWIYVYSSVGPVFTFYQEGVSRPGWEGPYSPAFADMKDNFVDLQDAEGWYAGGVMALCGFGEDYGFAPMVTTSGVSVQEIGSCFDFYPPQTYESFAPFGYASAPPHAAVGAMLYNDVGGLWVFRGT